MITVIVVPNHVTNQFRMIELMRPFLLGMSSNVGWKWVGKNSPGEPMILYNEQQLSPPYLGTLYRHIRPGDIIILKDGKYVY